MVVVARLKRGKQTIASYPFNVETEEDFQRGAREAFTHFRRLHPEVRMFNSDVIVTFGTEGDEE